MLGEDVQRQGAFAAEVGEHLVSPGEDFGGGGGLPEGVAAGTFLLDRIEEPVVAQQHAQREVPAHQMRQVALDLSAEEGLHSHLPAPDEFDSRVEAAFAEKWGTEKRDGWRLVREGEILHQRQKVFVPDFAFRHDDGRTLLMEIVGFWTPEYLQAKRETLRTFRDHRILLAVAERIGRQTAEPTPGIIRYKTALRIKDVLEQLNAPSNAGEQ